MLETSSVPTEQVKQWLGDIKPLWPLLGEVNIMKLLVSFPFSIERVVINKNELFEEISDSLGMKAVKLILSEAMTAPGIKLTVKDNLNRSFVVKAIDQLEWPRYRPSEIFEFCKVVNERDFLPLHFFHVVLKAAGLVRKYKGHLVATKKGKELYQDDKNALFDSLYSSLYEQIDISYFDRVSLNGWPNLQIGIVLWCLTMIDNEWIPEEILMKKTAIPDKRFWESPRDLPEFAFHARILRPLWWFGLLEHRIIHSPELKRETDEFKKSKAFDRVFAFDLLLSKDGRFMQ